MRAWAFSPRLAAISPSSHLKDLAVTRTWNSERCLKGPWRARRVHFCSSIPTVMMLECRRWKRKSNQLEKKRGGQGELQVWQDQGLEQRHQGSGPLSVPSSAGTSLATSDRGLPFPTGRKDSGHPPSVPGAMGVGTLITRCGEERTGPHIRPCRVDSEEQRPLGPSRGAGLGRGRSGSGQAKPTDVPS